MGEGEPETQGGSQRTAPATVRDGTAPRRECWVFTHLQKAGGSTLKTILRNQWKRGGIDTYDARQWVEGDEFTRKVAKHLLSEGATGITAGGYTEALRGEMGEICKWFVMFRHPVSRLVSAYYYCQARPIDVACASSIVKAKDVSLEDFARHWGNFAFRQLVLGFLPADPMLEFFGKKGPFREYPGWYRVKAYLNHQGSLSGGDETTVMYDMLHDVWNLIRDQFDVVGILEEFHTSLTLLDRVLQIPNVNWTSSFSAIGVRNEDQRFARLKAETLESAWTNSDIKGYMTLDLLLYEHAVEVFKQQAKLHGLR